MDKAEANKLAWSYRRMAQRYISAADQIIKVAAEIQPDQDDDADMEHIDRIYDVLAKLRRQLWVDFHSLLIDIGIVSKRRAKHAGERAR